MISSFNLRKRSYVNPLGIAYVFLLIVSMTLLQACDPDEDRSQTGFNGIVTSSGKAVANAAVSLAGDNGQYSTVAGADGRFQINEVAAGDYLLTVNSELDDKGKFVQYQKEVSVTAAT